MKNKKTITDVKSNPDFGTVGPNGIYKNSVKLLDLLNPDDISFYEQITNMPNKYIFTKGDIISHPSGKIYMLMYYAELIQELKALTEKYSAAEAAAKTPPPDMVNLSGFSEINSVMEMLTSPVSKIYNR